MVISRIVHARITHNTPRL